MKKIIAITLCMICFLALICIPASAERVDRDSNYYVRVETNPIGRDGAHIDTVYVPHGEKCTLTIDESVKDLYTENTRSYREACLTGSRRCEVLPLGMISPQTGDAITPSLVTLLVIGLVYLGFAIWYFRNISKLCNSDRRQKHGRSKNM